MPACIVASASVLPEKIVNNDELESRLGLRSGWIFKNSGIVSRRVETKPVEELYGDITKLLIQSSATMIDTIVVAYDILSSFRRNGIPGFIHNILKSSKRCSDFVEYIDGFHSCTGLMQAVNVASMKIESGKSKGAMVIGASRLSEYELNMPKELYTMWGDGASGFILGPSKESECIDHLSYAEPDNQFTVELKSDGNVMHADSVGLYRWVMDRVPVVVNELLSRNNVKKEDMKVVLLHQPSVRIFAMLSESLDLRSDQLVPHAKEFGNLNVASIGVSYDFAKDQLISGDYYLMCSFGKGMMVQASLCKKP